MAESLATEEQAHPAEAGDGVEVSEAQLPEAAEEHVPAPGGKLDILLETTMQVSVRLGHAGNDVSGSAAARTFTNTDLPG